MIPSTTECITARTWKHRRFSADCLLKTGRIIISCVLISALGSSCCTTTLWDATDPNETIEVSPEEITEAALIEDGFVFHRDQKSGYFHIEKTRGQKGLDYGLRAAGAPVTVTADALLVVALGLVGANPLQANWSTLNR